MDQRRDMIRLVHWRSIYGWMGTLVFLCLVAVQPVLANPAVAIKVKGAAERKLPGVPGWDPIQIGDRLPEGTQVRTGEKSEVELALDQGHHLRIIPNTLVTLSSLQENKTKTYLSAGKVLSKVTPLKTQEQFLIQTPTAVCAVRGTEFWTGVNARETAVEVYKGTVGMMAQGTHTELAVHAGESASILRDGSVVPPHSISKQNASSGDSALTHNARHEVSLDMTRDQVMAAAAAEIRLAEYREGKSLVDVNGNRVRLEEYIIRPAPDQFKFVVLDQRDQRLDYFFYHGTFNQNLPADLSLALKDISGKFGTTAPDYYLTSYEMGQSNTQDSVHDTASGGHLVSIAIDTSGNYVLRDNADPTNTRTVNASTLIGTDSDGNSLYSVYNPLADSFSTVTAAQLSASTRFGMYIPENNAFRDLASGDTFWKTRFDSYTHALNDATKISYSPSTANSVLARNLDANWTYAGGTVLPVVTPDPNNVDATVTNYYGDGTFESYRTTLIDNQGNIAPLSAFDGISNGSAYKNELLKWNYEQQVTATEFHGRKIDLVVEPRIFIESGLIQ